VLSKGGRIKRKGNKTFKALLVLDNAPGHLQDSGLTHQNIESDRLCNTSISFQQLLNQETIIVIKGSYTHYNSPGHKGCYTHCTFSSVSDAREQETFLNVRECYRSYRISDCIVSLKEKLQSMALNGYW
jgi:hypothetical protein